MKTDKTYLPFFPADSYRGRLYTLSVYAGGWCVIYEYYLNL
jgi:hypothetical protein